MIKINIFDKLTLYLGKKIVAGGTALICILNIIWGLPLNIIGFIVFLVLSPFTQKARFKGSVICMFKKPTFAPAWGGFNLGFFIFLPYSYRITMYKGNLEIGSRAIMSIISHEYGHFIQNAMWGPLMMFVVSIPSVIRFWYLDRKYYKRGLVPINSYDNIWFERTATSLGGYAKLWEKT